MRDKTAIITTTKTTTKTTAKHTENKNIKYAKTARNKREEFSVFTAVVVAAGVVVVVAMTTISSWCGKV